MRRLLAALYTLYALILLVPVVSSCDTLSVANALEKADKAIQIARDIAEFLLAAVPNDATRGEAQSLTDDLIDAAIHMRNAVEASGPASREALAAFGRFKSAYGKVMRFGQPYKLAQAARGMPEGLMRASNGSMLAPHIDDLDPGGDE